MNNRRRHLLCKSDNRQAFSLVEVVLAIGVTSFALLGMVALLPMGLKTSHQAADAMTQAQIVQYMRNQMEMTPFANLSTWVATTANTPLYFDNQGLPTTNADPENIYRVTLALTTVQMSMSGNAATNVLIYTGPASTSTNAMIVQVNIVNHTMPGASATNVFPIVVPNAGF